MAKHATKGLATSPEDIVVSLKPHTVRKPTAEIKTKRMKEGHRLDELLQQRGHLTIRELCDETRYSLSRVLEHVNYIIDKGVANLVTALKNQTSSRSASGATYQKLAEVYCKLLNGIDWNDKLMVLGIREGLNKFLSNAFASQFPKGHHKHHKTHLITDAAIKQLNAKNYESLVYEHLVPKRIYIQKPCEELAAKKQLTVDFVAGLLNSYWKVATVTKDEDNRLKRTSMPDDWDEKNIFARYELAGIKLQTNPYYFEIIAKQGMVIIEKIGG